MICFALAAADVDAGQSIPGDAGDYFFGKKFLPKEPAKEREMRLKELENGRLAMVAFGGICTQAAPFISFHVIYRIIKSGWEVE